MESGLKGAKFRLLDANKMPMHYLKGEKAGQEIVFTTDEIKEIVHITDENGETVDKEVIRTGYVEVVLHQEQDGLAIRKNVPYYLEEIEAPVVKDDNGKVTERFEPDFTLYSFMISDNPNYNAPGGVYVYSSGDVLKVRNWPDEGGFWLAKRFNGNAQPPASVLNAMRFTLKKLNSQGEYETVRTLSWGDLNNGKLHITGLQPGTYMVVETGAEPPAGSGLTHITEYMVDGEDKNEGAVFTLTEEDLTNAVSHNVVITNTYYEKSFSITKVDQDSQAALRGAVFEARRADDDSLVTTYTTGGVQGRFAIQREINANQNYAYNTLYYVVETRPPEGYGYTDKGQIKSYFYFSDPADPQTPEGAGSAVDLTREFGTVTLENVGVEKTSVVATKAWQGLGGGTAAPNGATVTFTLFRDGEKVDGSEIVLNGVPDEVTEETTRAETQAWRAEWTDLVKWHWGNEGEKVDYDYMIRTAMATSRRPSPIPTRSGPRT